MAYFKSEVLLPIFSFLYDWIDHIQYKMGIAATSIVGYMALDLFSTPANWWKGLTYLVLIDWASGIINAIYYRKFEWHHMTRKPFQITGYIMCCGAVAILANGMSSVFYYLQFIVYAAFFSREFYSIFRIWRLWATFIAAFKFFSNGKEYMGEFTRFTDAIDREQLRFEKQKMSHGPTEPGPKGERGEKGEKGDKGDRGIPG